MTLSRLLHRESDGTIAAIALNDQFHFAIYAGAHNATLEQIAIELRQRLTPLRFSRFFEKDRLAESTNEHARLVEALGQHDKNAAAAMMRSHCAHTGLNVLSRMKAGAHRAVSSRLRPGPDSVAAVVDAPDSPAP